MQGHKKAKTIIGEHNLSALRVLSDGPGLVFLLGHAAALASTGWLLWLSLGSWWIIGATILHGVVIVHLFSPFHEATHGTAFKSRWLNAVVGFVSGLAIMIPPTFFKYEHAAHHAYTADIDRDPEMIPMADRLGGYLYYATAMPYFVGVFSTLLRFPLGRYSEGEKRFLRSELRQRVRRETLWMWACYFGIAVASVVFGSWYAVLFWLLPRFAGEPVMRLIRMSEHVGCATVPDIFRNTRTVLTLAPARWLGWNNSYHAEHHAFPIVPFHALGRLHQAIGAEMADVRHGYVRTQLYLVRHALGSEERNA